MKVLIVSSRFPWPPYTGDRLRALIWIEALLPVAEVTLVAPAGEAADPGGAFHHVPARRGGRVSAGAQAFMKGLPFHSLVSAGHDWSEALQRAESERGPFDVAVVLLSRLHPWVDASIRAPRKILDAIDSLALSVEQRAGEARGPWRAFWRREVGRTRVLESGISDFYERVIVVNEKECPVFGSKAVAIPNGVAIEPLADSPREFDFGFWGRLAYFANRDAALLLTSEIWPALRAKEPDSRFLIAGADAPKQILQHDGIDGVRVISPMEDRSAVLRNISIALFPVRFGTGQSNKLLEAAEAGCAIVATPEALRGLDELAAVSVVEPDVKKFPEVSARLLRDQEKIESMRKAGRSVVETHYSREASSERLRRAVFEGAEGE